MNRASTTRKRIAVNSGMTWRARATISTLAMVGPASVAGAHFIQSMVLLHHVSHAAFGGYAFLLSFVAFCWTAWQATFCAPLPHSTHAVKPHRQRFVERIAGSGNLTASLLGLPLFAAVPLLVGLDYSSAAFFAAFACISLLRWFGRAHAYLHARQLRSFLSDIVYASALTASILALASSGEVTLAYVYGSMGAAALVALFPFGREFLEVSTAELGRRPVRRWIRLTGARSSWSLASVTCGELAVNATAYMVTIVAGGTAYAPIAATGLLIRPIFFASVAVQDVERPRLAGLIRERSFKEAQTSLAWARATLVLAWLATALAVAVLFALNPYLLFPRSYGFNTLLAGAVLWMGVSGLSALQGPDWSLLQALGLFRETAVVKAQAAAISVFVTGTVLLFAAPVWSVAGLIAGQLVNTYSVARLSRNCRSQWPADRVPAKRLAGS
ncbi:MAG TPA: hypothetical protein VIL42_00600 [Sphingomicrobium sp.]|jgi:hypothetical protein